MIVYALFIYLGIVIGVSNWFYWIVGIIAFVQIVRFGYSLYEKGKNDGKK